MAFESIGLGGILTFNSAQAIGGMTRAGVSFQGLTMKSQRLRASLSTIGGGLSRLTFLALPAAGAIGWMAKKAYDFESALAGLKAITGATGEELEMLEDKAMKLGIETVFSASQATEAMTILGKMGFSAAETVEAVDGVLAAAAAESIEMAEAAEIVGGALRGMQLETADAGRVANILAQVAISSATDIKGLGESFSYAASRAATAGVDIETLSASFGVLGNASLLGSRAGTSMEALIKGLLGTTPRSAAAIEELGVQTRDASGNLRFLPDVLDDVIAAMDQIPDAQLRDQLAFKIFRDQGSRAFAILRARGTEELRAIIEDLRVAADVTDESGKKMGSAGLMAARRLNSLQGATILLKSSLESLGITMFKSFLKPAAVALNSVIYHLNNFLFAYNKLSRDASPENVKKLMGEFGENVVLAAMGVRDGFAMIRNAWVSVKTTFREMGEQVGMIFGEADIQSIVKWVTAITLAIAVLSPLALVLKGVLTVAGGLYQVIAGGAGLIVAFASFLPVIAAVGGVLGLVFLAARNDGDSFMDTVNRLKDAFIEFGRIAYGVLESIHVVATSIAVDLGQRLMPVVQGLFDFLRSGWGMVNGLIYAYGDAIFEWWISFSGLVWTALQNITDGLVAVFTNGVFPVLDQLLFFIERVVIGLGGIANMLTVGLLPQWENLTLAIRYALSSLGTMLSGIGSGVFSVLNAVWAFFQNMIMGMQAGFASLVSIIGASLNFIGSTFAFVGDMVSFIGEKLAWVINEFSWLGTAISTIFNGILAVLQPAFDLVFAIGQELFNRVYMAIVAIWGHLQPVFTVLSQIGQSLWDVVGPAFEGIFETVGSLLGVIKEIWGWLEPLRDLVGSALVGAFNAVFDVVKDILSFVKEIIDGVKWIVSAGGIGSNMSDIVRQLQAQQATAAADAARGATSTTTPAPTRARAAAPTRSPAAAVGAATTERASQTTPPTEAPPVVVNDERKLDIETTTNIDGRCVSAAHTRNQREINERAGFETTPWQTRAAVVRTQDLTQPG